MVAAELAYRWTVTAAATILLIAAIVGLIMKGL
jgi:hypothetical protein